MELVKTGGVMLPLLIVCLEALNIILFQKILITTVHIVVQQKRLKLKGDLQGSDILPMFCPNTSFQLYGWFASSWGGRDVKDGRPEVPNFPANNLTLKLYFGII